MFSWVWLVSLVVVVVIVVLGEMLFFRVGRIKGLRDQQKLSQPVLEEYQRAVEDYSKLVVKLREESEQLRAELERVSRLEKTHREMNETFAQQSKQAWDRYHAAGLGAGNAQAMLLRQLEAAVRQLNEYRRKEGREPIQVNEGLRNIVQEFKRDHVPDRIQEGV